MPWEITMGVPIKFLGVPIKFSVGYLDFNPKNPMIGRWIKPFARELC
tara:strand:- start:29187 stop:29327 length:141 start_codon:yes stop_codon:yes gene_type:complete